jgi:hypothetical protein
MSGCVAQAGTGGLAGTVGVGLSPGRFSSWGLFLCASCVGPFRHPRLIQLGLQNAVYAILARLQAGPESRLWARGRARGAGTDAGEEGTAG